VANVSMPSQSKNVKRIDPTINKHEDLAGHDRAKNKPLPKERLVDI
jgi:hypothetical protein